jgi:hypothetical protein
LQIEKVAEKLRATTKTDLEKAAALISETNINLPPVAPGGAINGFEHPAPGSARGGVHFENIPPEMEGGKMDKEKLKKEHPELYAAIYGEGKEAGIAEERERVEAHLKLGEDLGAMKVAAQFIREGKLVMENKVQAEYLSAQMKNSAINARSADNPPPVNPAGAEGADDAAMEAAWNKGLAGKDLQEGK